CTRDPHLYTGSWSIFDYW
nr:immunoglobulin heavy chain junction region [Macaca mulatta]MOY22790.1 immunoglobulin heavy chain junction region [Macaca mulatta]MOY25469.1 immunoglobulin heavy chain junction region [Macaca mulatta]MOY26785.1 immunoglobulin heavy chain junction region [Macaca mulatta]MOY26832.1 immunoglobulin heavy chain junction region [Macaca mulatta]